MVTVTRFLPDKCSKAMIDSSQIKGTHLHAAKHTNLNTNKIYCYTVNINEQFSKPGIKSSCILETRPHKESKTYLYSAFESSKKRS